MFKGFFMSRRLPGLPSIHVGSDVSGDFIAADPMSGKETSLPRIDRCPKAMLGPFDSYQGPMI
jgi:hypothetical protein